MENNNNEKNVVKQVTVRRLVIDLFVMIILLIPFTYVSQRTIPICHQIKNCYSTYQNMYKPTGKEAEKVVEDLRRMKKEIADYETMLTKCEQMPHVQ